MAFLHFFLLATLYSNTNTAIAITCETVTGTSSGNGDDYLSSVSCSLSSYIMVSCGMKTVTSSEFTKQGSWVSGQTCYAQNGYEGDGVYAYGRCCDLSAYDFSCTQYESSVSGSGDGTTVTRQCPNANQVLMGCSIRAEGNNLDGCYPGTTYTQPAGSLVSSNNQCTAVVSISHEPVYSAINCCSSADSRYSFECYQKWSSSSNTNVGAITSVSCPSTGDYFMTGCSGIGLWANMNSYTIEDNICYARNGAYHVDGRYVYAVAICCKLIITPTKNPTKNPTKDPVSANPTTIPTVIPTKVPSLNPSLHPTLYPTLNPTITPSTFAPTLSPTTKHPSTSNPTSSHLIVPAPNIKSTNGNEGIVKTTMDIKATKDHKMHGPKDSLLWYQYLIYIIVGCFVILIFIFIFIVVNKRRKRKHQETTDLEMIESSSANGTSIVIKSNSDIINDKSLSNMNTCTSDYIGNDNKIIDNEDSNEQIYDNTKVNNVTAHDETKNDESMDGLYGNNDIITPENETKRDIKYDENKNENDNDDDLYSDNKINLPGNTTKDDDTYGNPNNASPFHQIDTVGNDIVQNMYKNVQ